MNKEFKQCETKKCTVDNLHPNWKNQELTNDMVIKFKTKIKKQNHHEK